jgi:3-oxoacyl-[acyl-carrier protein] reductase
MSKKYLLIGASSHVSIALANILKTENHQIIGISRQETNYDYDSFYQIENYQIENLPTFDFPIDGLVYFPGTINLKPFHRLTPQDFLNDLQVNVLGATATIQKYLNNLKQSENPSIVLISSVAATTGMPFHASIGMAKAALEGLSKALAAEFAPKIRVNTVAPSLTNTPLAQKFLASEEKIELAKQRNPMKKVGSADDLAQTIHFLLSEKSNWITGQTFAVDGGMGSLKV